MIVDVTPGHCEVCDEGMPKCCFECRLKYMARWQEAHPIDFRGRDVADREESEFDTPSYDGLAAVDVEIDQYRQDYL